VFLALLKPFGCARTGRFAEDDEVDE